MTDPEIITIQCDVGRANARRLIRRRDREAV